MNEFKQIILTTDFSPNAASAIPFAVALAKHNAGMIDVFYCFEERSQLGHAKDRDRSVMQERERELAALAGRITDQYGVITHYTLAKGRPAVEAARYAEESRADVIVTATHGRSGLAHMVLGAVAERILRLSSVPVLTVRPSEQVRPFDSDIGFKIILMATDFSDNAAAAEELACALAKKDGASLAVLHVIDDSGDAAMIEPPMHIAAIERWMEEELASAEQLMAQVSTAITTRTGVKCERIITTGRAAEEICRVATRRGADLIVMSTHGYSGLSHFVFGSVAEKVVRHSTVPVLSIKPASVVEKK